jgi:threonine/homoserine efflux transporter RhtA
MVMSVVWVAVVIGIIILLKRKKEQLQKIDDIGV